MTVSAELGLFDAFQHGTINTIICPQSQVQAASPTDTKLFGPKAGKRWLILNGWIDHTTGTTTRLSVNKKDLATKFHVCIIPTGEATANGVPFPNMKSDYAVPANALNIMETGDLLDISSGDSIKNVCINYIEW